MIPTYLWAQVIYHHRSTLHVVQATYIVDHVCGYCMYRVRCVVETMVCALLWTSTTYFVVCSAVLLVSRTKSKSSFRTSVRGCPVDVRTLVDGCEGDALSFDCLWPTETMWSWKNKIGRKGADIFGSYQINIGIMRCLACRWIYGAYKQLIQSE